MTYSVQFVDTDGKTPITLPGMHVLVRPDEVVLRAGDISHPAPADNFPPFIANILKDGVLVDQIGFPTLYYYTDFKWPIKPDAVALGGSPAELTAAELVPPVGII